MNWEECEKIGLVEKRTPDAELAKSLLKIASERFDFFSSGRVSIFALEGVYEAILELCHALLALDGLKTLSHECAIEFLRNRYAGDSETEFLQKMRKKRHGVKYYGSMLDDVALQKYLEKGRTLFLELKNLAEEKVKSM